MGPLKRETVCIFRNVSTYENPAVLDFMQKRWFSLPSDDSFQEQLRFSDLQNELGPECTLALIDPLGKALQPTALKFMSAKRLCEKVAKSPPL